MTNYHSKFNPTIDANGSKPASFVPEIIGSRPLQDKFNKFVWSKYGYKIQQDQARQKNSKLALSVQNLPPTSGEYAHANIETFPLRTTQSANLVNGEKIYTNYYMEPYNREGYPQDDRSPFLDRSMQQGGYAPAIYSDSVMYGQGIDPKLSQFVNKYCVEMSDGAVIVKDPKTETQKKKTVEPNKFPCGCTKMQFIVITLAIILIIAFIVIGLAVGLTQGKMFDNDFPAAKLWWKRSLIYEIHVRTHANDVRGPVGRLQDVISRIPYYYHQVGALALLINDLNYYDDSGGVRDFKKVDPLIDPDDNAMSSLIPRLKEKCQKPDGPRSKERSINILLGLELYATSNVHSWFLQSSGNPSTKFGNYYVWKSNASEDLQEARYWAFDSTRRAWYRHTHGNPRKPILNLQDSNVQDEIDGVLNFWKNSLGIKGVAIKNSSFGNLINEMVPHMKNILLKHESDDFIWFADDQQTDDSLENANVCVASLVIKERLNQRSDDLTNQLIEYKKSPRFQNRCVTIWRVKQEANNDRDYQTIMGLAYFLPGNFLMTNGQETFINNGDTSLMKWLYYDYLDYETYYPFKQSDSQSRSVMNKWVLLKNAIWRSSLLKTDPSDSPYTDLSDEYMLNDVSIFKRTFASTQKSIYFVVSFSTLNIDGILNKIVGKKAYVIYDSKGIYTDTSINLANVQLTNNQILLLYT